MPPPRYAADADPGGRVHTGIVTGVSDDVRRDPLGHTDSGPDPTPAHSTMRSTGRSPRSQRARVSKWDRPPDPHDWRFFVGMTGRVLISLGILMFGFVAYQLWGTGLETARAQNSLGNRFEAAVAADDDPPATTPPPSTTPDTTTPDEPAPDDESAESVVDTAAIDGIDLTTIAIDQDIPDIIPGEAFARLELPKIGKDLYVVPGVDVEDLKKGPGHYPDSPLPGQLGNASIAGHRTTYGEPFFDIDQLAPGDQMIVTMITGDRFVYEVTGTQIVTAADYWVVTTTDPTIAELTLTSCHPKFSASQRIVVKGLLVPELSDAVGVAEFYDLDRTDDATIPGDDPTFVPSDEDRSTITTLAAEVDDQSNDLAVGSPEDDEAPTSTTPLADDPVVEDSDGTDVADALARGWFDDRDAWPQIALWGLALVAISLGAHRVSKRTRHDSIGLAVGITPFLISLYFFFQNVNRLLPPGL
ncbi:MAG: hypothetical protein RLZZ01_1810 [Actinomycetota bacterium]